MHPQVPQTSFAHSPLPQPPQASLASSLLHQVMLLHHLWLQAFYPRYLCCLSLLLSLPVWYLTFFLRLGPFLRTSSVSFGCLPLGPQVLILVLTSDLQSNVHRESHISPTPTQIFTKVMTPISVVRHRLGFRLLRRMVDWLILTPSLQEAIRATLVFRGIFRRAI